MSPSEFKPPKRTPTRRGHLERLTGDYGYTYGIAPERARRWLSLVSFAGTLDAARADDGPRFLIKGGASMESPTRLSPRSSMPTVPLDVDAAAEGVRDFIAAIDAARR